MRIAVLDASQGSVPRVPPDKLEQANQLSLFTTYGTAPVAGLLFSLLALLGSHVSGYFTTNQVSIALYFNAATFEDVGTDDLHVEGTPPAA